jgi:hypothetical protein
MVGVFSMTVDLSQTDRDALERAIQILRREPERAQRIDEMLKHQKWSEVAAWAAYHCQMESLKLGQHINPPCWIHEDDTEEEDKDEQELLRRMLAAGLSRYEPDPLAALKAKGISK